MQTKLIDLIVHMVKIVQVGDNLRDIKPDVLKAYNKSEISAAYSWVIQKMNDGAINLGEKEKKNMRVLHTAERMMMNTDAQGYLIELHAMGILNFYQLESVIELSMMNHFEKVTLEGVKTIVAEQLFGSEKTKSLGGMYLRGNESVN